MTPVSHLKKFLEGRTYASDADFVAVLEMIDALHEFPNAAAALIVTEDIAFLAVEGKVFAPTVGAIAMPAKQFATENLREGWVALQPYSYGEELFREWMR